MNLDEKRKYKWIFYMNESMHACFDATIFEQTH